MPRTKQGQNVNCLAKGSPL